MDKYLQYLLIAGLAVALFGNFVLSADMVNLLVVIIGATIGIINIDTREALAFLVAAIAIATIGTGAIVTLPIVGGFLGGVIKAFVLLAGAAAIPVALKTIWDLAK